ncbi:MAG: tetratricopeptide repeat protein [Candidatus Hydrogenedentota bacterium]
MATTVNCPYCGKLTDPKLDACPHCGGFMKKKPAPAPKSSSPSQTCPSCQAVVQRGDIICIVCGTNLLTGQKVADAPTPSGSGGNNLSTGIIIFIAVAVVVLLAIMGLTYLNNSDTVGRARALIADFKYLEATDLLTNYVQGSPDDDEAWFELGKLQRRAKRYDDAAESLKVVVDINPANVDAGLLAVLSMEQGSRSSIDQEIAILERVAEHSSNSARAWHLLALALSTRGGEQDIERQISALERVISLSPDSESAKLDLGIGYILDGNYREARFTLDSVTSANLQGNTDVSLAYMDALDANADRAIAGFDRALSTDTVSIRWQAQTSLAQLLIAQGRFRDAELNLQAALTENPNNDYGRYLRGIALHALNRLNEALSEFEAVSRVQGPHTGLATIQAANIQLALGNVSAAERLIGIARRNGIETPAYHTVNGRVQGLIGDKVRALQSFDTAIKMDPTYAPAYLERGLANVEQDRVNAGVQDLNRYLSLLGRDSIGTKANEIRLLASQLQRTLVGGAGR